MHTTFLQDSANEFISLLSATTGIEWRIDTEPHYRDLILLSGEEDSLVKLGFNKISTTHYIITCFAVPNDVRDEIYSWDDFTIKPCRIAYHRGVVAAVADISKKIMPQLAEVLNKVSEVRAAQRARTAQENAVIGALAPVLKLGRGDFGQRQYINRKVFVTPKSNGEHSMQLSYVSTEQVIAIINMLMEVGK